MPKIRSDNLGSRRTKLLFWCSLPLLLGMLVYGGMTWGRRSVEQMEESIRENLDRELQNPNNRLVEFVERSHKTVKVKSAKVTKCALRTSGGGKADGSDIELVDIEITLKWDGIFHKNGETVVGYSVMRKDGKPVNSTPRIIRTTARINRPVPYPAPQAK